MTLLINGHSYHYEMENLCRLFFPYERIKTVEGRESGDDITAYTGVLRRGDSLILVARLKTGAGQLEKSQTAGADILCQDKECERLLAVLLFDLLVQLCGFRPQWGILTGVRPIKLLRRLTAELGGERALDYFKTGLLVSEKKTELSLVTMKNEQKILSLSRPDSFSLYVSIPFCPTRCAYCSFVSQSVVRAARLIPEYVSLLCGELVHTARIAKELNLRLESVYIGGGTPTTLSPPQLEQLLDTIREHFDLTTCREFTVEAGRPDTVTPEKLAVLKSRGVTRISINPQTMNDDVLAAIGRRHTSAQTLEAFALARETGFGNINMDLIAGLPRDTKESFAHTLEKVLALAPESITVHTLALKRSSRLNLSGGGFGSDAADASAMLDFADGRLFSGGYLPYYLYRQSRMVGNLENTGWAKPGFESVYNVYVMDETHTVLACGAGAVSKIKDPGSDDLQRIFNFKFPYEYVSRNEEMILRKEQVKTLYEQFGK